MTQLNRLTGSELLELIRVPGLDAEEQMTQAGYCVPTSKGESFDFGAFTTNVLLAEFQERGLTLEQSKAKLEPEEIPGELVVQDDNSLILDSTLLQEINLYTGCRVLVIPDYTLGEILLKGLPPLEA